MAHSPFIFGTVTTLNPLHVRIDGETTPTPAVSAVGGGRLRIGSRVAITWTGTQLLAFGPLATDAR